MPQGEANAMVEAYRTILRECLSDLSPTALLKLRGELQVISRWLGVQKEDALKASGEATVDAVSRFYQFGQEIGGFTASSRSAESASYFDLASVGILAIENVLTAKRAGLMRILMSGLSEGLMFLGSRQYVAGSDAVLQATYRAHVIAVQDALWSIAADFGEPKNLDSIREARRAIDALFTRLDEPAVPLTTKLVLLHQLYGLVMVVRCAKLLEDLQALV